MATSATRVTNDKGQMVATFVDTAGGGTSKIVYTGDFPIKSVQRISGTGTYTVEGSMDGTTFGALGTAISAKGDAAIYPIPENPLYLRVTIAAAAATVVISGAKR
jgi:hypothetical protein